MKKERCVVFFLLVLFSLPIIRAQDVELELQMPSHTFSSGMMCRLDLHILNHGPDYPDAQLFIAFNLGTDDYWFYPSWCHYPGEIDNEVISISADEDSVKSIIPEFEWPQGAGEFVDAGFLSVVIHEGDLISNLAQFTFGWTVSENFVYIPPGTFEMGSPDDEMCRGDDEGPVHTVTITHGFFMQATEVTQSQWFAVLSQEPSTHENCMDCPVENVDWFECCVYCNELSMMEGLEPCYYSDDSYTTVFDNIGESKTVYWKQDADGYRLPTEAEWEYACRAGTTMAYNSGLNNTNCDKDPNLDPLAWYYYDSDETYPVGTKQPNAWGLYDMHGNVYEWCWDYYDADYYKTSPSSDPTGPSQGRERIERGGSWINDAKFCRSASRNHFRPWGKHSYIGFRPVRTLQ